MRLTIDIPDEQAHQLGAKQSDVEQRIKQLVAQLSKHAFLDELTHFLGKGPQPQEIMDFHASEKSQARVRELLEKNRLGSLNSDEQEELNAIELLNHVFALVKVEACFHLPAHS